MEKHIQDGTPKQEVYDMQKLFNEMGITDRDGNALKQDGKLGVKTDGAVHNAVKQYGNVTEQEPVRGDVVQQTDAFKQSVNTVRNATKASQEAKQILYYAYTELGLDDEITRKELERLNENAIVKIADNLQSMLGKNVIKSSQELARAFNTYLAVLGTTQFDETVKKLLSDNFVADDSLKAKVTEAYENYKEPEKYEAEPVGFLGGIVDMLKKTKLFDGIEEYNTIASKYGHNIANISAYYSKYYESLANKYAKEKNLRDSNGKKHISYDNEADAYRHSMWNVALTKNIGINEAKFIVDNHEIKALKDLGWLKSYENGIVKAKVNQPVLMDLWNNSVGRTLAKDSTLSDMSDEKLMNHALYHNMLITDATKAFEFYGINDYINTDDWTVDIEWDTSKNTIIVKKEGLKDIELLIGRYGD